jgi:Flp pilus assembly protein TadB
MAEPRDSSRLHLRRRRARHSRRRRLARIDVALGLVAAVVLLLASPGLAIAGIVALLVLAGCGVSLLVQRQLERRAARARKRKDDARRPPAAQL